MLVILDKKNIIKYIILAVYAFFLSKLLVLNIFASKSVFSLQSILFYSLIFSPFVFIIILKREMLIYIYIILLGFVNPGLIKTISVAHLYVFLLCFGWVFFGFKENFIREKYFFFEEKILLLFFCIICISIIQTVYIPNNYILLDRTLFYNPYIRSIIQTIIWGIVILSFIFSFRLLIKNSNMCFLEKSMKVYALTATVISFFCLIFLVIFLKTGFILSMSNYSIFVLNGKLELVNFPRIKAFMAEPAVFAHYLTPVITYYGINFLYKKKWWFFIGFCINFLAFLFTFSRAGYFAFIVSSMLLIVFCFIKYKQNHYRLILKRLCIFLGVIFCLILGIYLFVIETNYKDMIELLLEDRVYNIFLHKDHSFNIKSSNYKTAYRVIKDYPILGVGIGNLWFQSKFYTDYMRWFTETYGWNISIVSNLFLQITVETGLVGGLLFIVFLFKIIVQAIKVFIREQIDDIFLLCLIISIFSLTLQFLFSCWILLHFFFILALTRAVVYSIDLKRNNN
jgi:O-antigen ligase